MVEGMSGGDPVCTGSKEPMKEVFGGIWPEGPVLPPGDKTGISLPLQSKDRRGMSFSSNKKEAAPQFESQKLPSRKDFWEKLVSP